MEKAIFGGGYDIETLIHSGIGLLNVIVTI